MIDLTTPSMRTRTTEITLLHIDSPAEITGAPAVRG